MTPWGDVKNARFQTSSPPEPEKNANFVPDFTRYAFSIHWQFQFWTWRKHEENTTVVVIVTWNGNQLCKVEMERGIYSP